METKEERESTIAYGLYLEDQAFKEKSNLAEITEEARRFYYGKQFDDDNEDNMIRVPMNFCAMCAKLKASKIVGTERYITFTADNVDYDCHGLQRFDEYNVHKLNEKSKEFQACIDGYVDGTAIAGYRWDKDDTTYKGIYKGGLVSENNDMLKFAVANKNINNIQNQKWVMYWKDEDVEAVRDMVERKDKKLKKWVRDQVVPDNYSGIDKEDVNHGLVTLFTRYFRVEGEVCFMCSTREVDLFEYPHFMNPRVNKSIKEKLIKIVDDYKKEATDDEEPNFDKVKDLKIDYEDMISQIAEAEIITDEAYKKDKEKFYLYPFARFVPDEMKDSFYGHGDIADMIGVQKGYNFAISMVLKCLENNAYNKIIVKEGALEGQEITNEPGQVIVDHTRMQNGYGIKFAESQPMPNGVIDFASKLFEQTRLIYGFNDVMNGDVSNQDISGYAVQQMIKQANSAIEQQQQLFWQFCKEKAEIRLMFYKFYVDKAKYTYELADYEVEDRENKRKMLLNRQKQLQAQGKKLEIDNGEEPLDLTKPTRKVQVREFAGEEIYGTSFDINIDVMQGLADSKLAEAQMWDTLIMNGNIQNLEPEMLELYLEANPTVSQRSKATLKAIVEKQKKSENYQLKQKLQEALQYLQKVLQYSKELEAQSGYKTNFINNLEKEFVAKIGTANKVITAQNQALSKQKGSEGEVKSNNARGVAGGDIQPGV